MPGHNDDYDDHHDVDNDDDHHGGHDDFDDHNDNDDHDKMKMMMRKRMAIIDVSTFNSAEHSHLAEIFVQNRHLLHP